ncbi:MAG: hypothetical protein KC464_00025, partial [Myxococcales bacterium]|nr:hypothetical protein [Myxococcales bacterium]
MAETRQTPGRPWRVRLGNPLSWSLADRCLTASIIVTVASAIFVASLYLGDGWPFVAFDLEHAPLVPVVSLVHLTPWLVLLGLSLRARRRT